MPLVRWVQYLRLVLRGPAPRRRHTGSLVSETTVQISFVSRISQHRQIALRGGSSTKTGVREPLAICAQRRILAAMRLWFAMSRLLAVLTVVGLVAGTIAPLAKAGSMSGMAAIAMSDGMTCCDPPQSAPDDCRTMKGCPFTVVCAAQCIPATARGEFSQMRLAVDASIPLVGDSRGDSFVSPPLGYPPKA